MGRLPKEGNDLPKSASFAAILLYWHSQGIVGQAGGGSQRPDAMAVAWGLAFDIHTSGAYTQPQRPGQRETQYLGVCRLAASCKARLLKLDPRCVIEQDD